VEPAVGAAWLAWNFFMKEKEKQQLPILED